MEVENILIDFIDKTDDKPDDKPDITNIGIIPAYEPKTHEGQTSPTEIQGDRKIFRE